MRRNVLLLGNFLSGSMVTRHVCEDMEVHLSAKGWTVFRASTKLARVPRAADMLTTAWRLRHRYDFAHIECYSGYAFFWAEWCGWLLRRLKKPFVLTLHSGDFPRFAERWPDRVRRLFSRATIVTSPSLYLAQQMKAYRPDLRVVPNALNLANYAYRPRERVQPMLVWLRGFLDYYNPFMGPKVIAALVKEFPQIHLAMIGPDKGDGSLARTRQLAIDLNVAKNISFPGGIPKHEVPSVLDQYDLFLNTTFRDNTPVSVIEAMALGLNVISTNVDGVPYLLHDGEDGLLVPPDDSEAMACAVRRLLTEPKLAERLATNARKRVERFDWSIVLPQWESLYSTATPSDAIQTARAAA